MPSRSSIFALITVLTSHDTERDEVQTKTWKYGLHDVSDLVTRKLIPNKGRNTGGTLARQRSARAAAPAKTRMLNTPHTPQAKFTRTASHRRHGHRTRFPGVSRNILSQPPNFRMALLRHLRERCTTVLCLRSASFSKPATRNPTFSLRNSEQGRMRPATPHNRYTNRSAPQSRLLVTFYLPVHSGSLHPERIMPRFSSRGVHKFPYVWVSIQSWRVWSQLFQHGRTTPCGSTQRLTWQRSLKKKKREEEKREMTRDGTRQHQKETVSSWVQTITEKAAASSNERL